MKRLLALLLALAFAASPAARAQQQVSADDLAAFQRIGEDIELGGVMDTLRQAGRAGYVAITDTSVIDPLPSAVRAHQTVIIRGERIVWVGDANSTPDLTGAILINGRGKFVAPDVVDMHVHTASIGQHILRLAAGVTSVRDMDGFPWLLRTREAIAQGRMIGATEYVAGTIIADQPLGGYAVVVHTPDEARQVVRNQAACGYSFIKIHNMLALSLFDAIAEETHRSGLDLVGHVPHDISLEHALHFGAMRTTEHLKGFILDQNLEPSSEPYGPALTDAQTWITPTLYARRDRVHGAEAQRLAADPRQRFNPRQSREDWAAHIPAEGSRDARIYDGFVVAQQTVMTRLLQRNPRWLVGTDAAGYPFMIAGYAALDEMVLMHQLGVPTADVIRAAGIEAAEAMRVPNEFGRVAPGERADLVLLSANPLADVGVYQHNEGVVARGRWYDRASLDAAQDALARIYAARAPSGISAAAAQALAAGAEARARAGLVFEDQALNAAIDALMHAGAADAARRLRALISAPATGPCVVNTPP